MLSLTLKLKMSLLRPKNSTTNYQLIITSHTTHDKLVIKKPTAMTSYQCHSKVQHPTFTMVLPLKE